MDFYSHLSPGRSHAERNCSLTTPNRTHLERSLSKPCPASTDFTTFCAAGCSDDLCYFRSNARAAVHPAQPRTALKPNCSCDELHMSTEPRTGPQRCPAAQKECPGPKQNRPPPARYRPPKHSALPHHARPVSQLFSRHAFQAPSSARPSYVSGGRLNA